MIKNGLIHYFVAMTLTACGAVNVASAALISNTFQSDTPGSNPAGAAFIIEPAATGARIVDSSTTPVDPFGGAGNQSLMMFDSSTTNATTVGYQFADRTKVLLSIDFYIEKNGTWNLPSADLRFSNSLNPAAIQIAEIGPWLLLNGRNNPQAATSARLEVREAGSGTSTVFIPTTPLISYNTPHTLDMIVDAATDTFTMSLDGVPVTRSGGSQIFNFRSPLTAVNGLQLVTAISTTVASRVYFDNLSVTVPEPASLALLGLASCLLFVRRS